MALDKLNSRRYSVHKQRVFARDGRVCRYCGSDEEPLHIDHIIPRKAGGTHDLDNLQVLCKSCNLRKSSKQEGVFLAQTATPPVFPERSLSETVRVVPTSPFVKPESIQVNAE
jgi:5-methylcytosine-specific restriction endonuclease McrA